jgi:hypothetical protein
LVIAIGLGTAADDAQASPVETFTFDATLASISFRNLGPDYDIPGPIVPTSPFAVSHGPAAGLSSIGDSVNGSFSYDPTTPGSLECSIGPYSCLSDIFPLVEKVSSAGSTTYSIIDFWFYEIFTISSNGLSGSYSHADDIEGLFSDSVHTDMPFLYQEVEFSLSDITRVAPVPVPAAGWLLAGSIAGLSWLRKRQLKNASPSA